MEIRRSAILASMSRFLTAFVILAWAGCGQTNSPLPNVNKPAEETNVPVKESFLGNIGEIPTPRGFTRIAAGDGSFTSWLRAVPLKKEKTVYLYNGQVKPNQSAQFAVIDIPTGNKDLQQCADVVMRLRAEYLFQYKKYNEIAFMDYAGKWYRWNGGDQRDAFDNYLQTVFGWCGSASLQKQLKPVTVFGDIKPGDVLVQGGFPGHAVIVADMAINKEGKKIYLLVQGYQPAQDMHVLLNPNDPDLSPWYAADMEGDIITPEWRFNKPDLKTW
jgi:hypothetical protein